MSSYEFIKKCYFCVFSFRNGEHYFCEKHHGINLDYTDEEGCKDYIFANSSVKGVRLKELSEELKDTKDDEEIKRIRNLIIKEFGFVE